MKSIEEINQQIAELTLEKKLLNDEKNYDTIERIKSLEWTKESELSFVDDSIYAAGIPTWRFDITYDGGPQLTSDYRKCIITLEDNPNYLNKILLYNTASCNFLYDSKCRQIASYSAEYMIKFLSKYKFRKIHFNEYKSQIYNFLLGYK